MISCRSGAFAACACDPGLVSYGDILVPGTIVELPVNFGGQGRLGFVASDCRVWAWHKHRFAPLLSFTFADYGVAPVRFLLWKNLTFTAGDVLTIIFFTFGIIGLAIQSWHRGLKSEHRIGSLEKAV